MKKSFCLSAIFAVLIFLSGCCNGIFKTAPWCQEDYGYTPSSITLLCPTHIGGDREFDGHGPNVKASAALSIKNEKEIWVTLYLHAKETKSDWTEAEGRWERKLWSAPTGKIIVDIDTDKSSEASYTDTDHSLDRPSVQGGSLVSAFEIMGDTSGNDVGNCTSGDVYMNVYFNEVRGSMRNE